MRANHTALPRLRRATQVAIAGLITLLIGAATGMPSIQAAPGDTAAEAAGSRIAAPLSARVDQIASLMALDVGEGQDNRCFAVADGYFDQNGSRQNDSGAEDTLAFLDRLTGVADPVGGPANYPNTGTFNIEAIAFAPGGSTLYGANANQLGTLNLATGAFTARPNVFGTGKGQKNGDTALENHTFSDADSLSFDGITGKLWAVDRVSGTTADILFQVNPATGQFVPNVFDDPNNPGGKVDYVLVAPKSIPDLGGTLGDIDDLAIDPVDGKFYAIMNQGGGPSILVTINPANGATTVVGRFTQINTGLQIEDMEGLAFFNDGQLYGSTGKDWAGTGRNVLWQVDKTNAVVKNIGEFSDVLIDVEALDCLVAPAFVTVEKSTNGQDADNPPGVLVPVGNAVTWTYLVRNTGGQTLSNVKVVDDNGTPGNTADDFTVCSGMTLAPGKSNVDVGTVCQANGGNAVAGQYGNVATATGQPTVGGPVSDTDPSHYFGYVPAAVGDYVWVDVDLDGIQDAFEPAVKGVKVRLFNATTNAQIGGAKTTTQQGFYLFDNLVPGNFYLTFDLSMTNFTNFTPVKDANANANDSEDSDVNPATGRTDNFTLVAGQTDRTRDAGLDGRGVLASVGDFVWEDLNFNGVQDAGEPGIAGVKVTLYALDGTPLSMKNTADGTGADPIGFYRFDNLVPDNYYLGFDVTTAPDGARYVVTLPNQNGDDSKDSDISPVDKETDTFVLGPGQVDLTRDAGYYRPVAIGDYVWRDANGNGQQDDGPTGVDGITVMLLDGSGNMVNSMLTAGGGAYFFNKTSGGADLVPGNYELKFTGLPNGWSFTLPNSGNDATDSDANPADGRTGIFAVPSNKVDRTRDAGLIRPTANIDIQKTVYKGHNAGAGCPGGELASDFPGRPVTYCFKVTNTGNTYLSNVTINDPDLGITQANMTLVSLGSDPLAPGGMRTFYYQTTITGNLLNEATTTGKPTTADGNPIPGVSDPMDKDTAEVREVDPGIPDISVAKTVYLGHNSGNSCPGSELVSGLGGTQVTYCFKVTNEGDTYLGDITLNDPDLGITQAQMTLKSLGSNPLAPGGMRLYYYQSTITQDLVNTVSTTGNPVDQNGGDIPGLSNPTDDDTAEVKLYLLDFGDAPDPSYPTLLASNGARHIIVPGISLNLGAPDDEPNGQPSAGADGDDTDGNDDEDGVGVPLLVPGQTADIGLSNAGNGKLNAWIDYNGDGDWNDAGEQIATDIGLGGGASVMQINVPLGAKPGMTYARFRFSSQGGLTPTGQAPDGEVEDYKVTIKAFTPAIEIQKTVYQGHDLGIGCPGGELVTDFPGTEITYCFDVTNTGDTHLADVTINDPDLGITQANMTLLSLGSNPLAPGDTRRYYYQTSIGGNLVNTASSTGNPTDANGTDIPNLSNPTDKDEAEVRAVDPGQPDILLSKTIYRGHNAGASCEGGELVVGTAGTPITYCFKVTNTGQTYLGNIQIIDADLGINQGAMTLLSQDSSPLAPGDMLVYYYQTTLNGDLVNTALTTGNPVDENGDDIPLLPDPEDRDTAERDEVRPAINLEKTVYAGHNLGASCQGGELVTDFPGKPVTYCFAVTNTGDTHLDDIAIADPDLGIGTIDLVLISGSQPLAPGGTMVFYYETLIATDLLNTAGAAGNPTEPDGTDLPGLNNPSDSDTAEVKTRDPGTPGIRIEKTVYAGHDAGASCQGGETLLGAAGAAITYCFQVINSGTTFLDDITIDDADLGITEGDMTLLSQDSDPLAPGDTLTYYYETTLNGDLVNTALAEGNPVDENGGDIPNQDNPTDEDTASVETLRLCIGNQVFRDLNNDGVYQPLDGETGFAVVKMNLYSDNGNGFLDGGDGLVDSTTTNATGKYEFCGLSPGDYIVEVDPANLTGAGVLAGFPTSTGNDPAPDPDDDVDNDDNGSDVAGFGVASLALTLSLGGEPPVGVDGDDENSNATVDFGFRCPLCLGDRIFRDFDGDGRYEPGAGDTGIDGVRLNLYRDTDLSGDLTGADEYLGSTDTADDGLYEFCDLANGEYIVEADPSNWQAGGALAGHISSLGNAPAPDPDDDIDNDDNGAPVAGYGVATLAVTLTCGGEPDKPDDGDGRDNNRTVDLGFQPVDPDITIEKTVYLGHNGGASCQGGELVVAESGKAVTYCFKITNSGDTYLDDITVDDGDLGISTGDLTLVGGDDSQPLAPNGGMLVYYYETNVAGDLVNTASTEGNPTDAAGDDLPFLDNPTDDDDAEVRVVRPAIRIDKTVYLGHDGGAGCPGGELVSDFPARPVTYCFKVTNTGDTHLDEITIDDADLGISEADMVLMSQDSDPLAPGDMLVYYYETVITTDLLNTATTEGNPVDENGTDIPGADKPTDDDTAEVMARDPGAPRIRIDKTVYLGHDGLASCEGQEKVVGVNGTAVTYCFKITNTGDTYLDDISIDDADLGISTGDLTLVTGDDSQPLAPSGMLLYAYQAAIDGDLLNTATTEGNPVDENGGDIPNQNNPTDDDTAEVDEVGPDIEISKTVYLGHDDGASCEGQEKVVGTSNTAVTYCFKVTNTGDTHLDDITVDDADLGVTTADLSLASGDDSQPLAPGGMLVFYYEATIYGDLVNTAMTMGNPTDPNGKDLPGVDKPTDDDTAEVDLVDPGIRIDKTVYLGHDGGASCQGLEKVVGTSNATVTYCFKVTNTGDTYLDDITVDDADLGVTTGDLFLASGDDSQPLAPGGMLTYYYEATIYGDLVNTAMAMGNPTDPNGNDLPGVDKPVDDDTAEVDLVDPGIRISKTVYLGHDGGASCEGQEKVVGTNGTAVTYCFKVTNTGDTYLDDVTVDDADLGISTGDLSLAAGDDSQPLAPGGMLTYFFETSIDTDLVNTAMAMGNPTDPNGTDLPGVDKPVDEDTAEVDQVGPGIQISKTVYTGHNAGAGCEGGELATGFPGAAITYCFKITNTGNTHLDDITVDDADLGISTGDLTLIAGNDGQPLAPGSMLLYYYESNIDGDLLNTASTEGNPTDPNGGDLPGVPNPTDDDTARVDERDPAILCLGNQVFFDLDNDGRFEIIDGEFPIDGVKVNLYRDTDLSGDRTAGDTFLASMTTAGGGRYEFCQLLPGEYIVALDGSNFDPGGVLNGLETSAGNDILGSAPDPDDDVDNDDNGGLVPGFGVATKAVTLTLGGEPAGGGNSNPTVDFGLKQIDQPTNATFGGFEAELEGGKSVEIRWWTLSERGVLGYNLYRKQGDGAFERINEGLIPAGDVRTGGARYSFVDSLDAEDSYLYRLEIVEEDGSAYGYGPIGVDNRPQSSRGVSGTSMQQLFLPLVMR